MIRKAFPILALAMFSSILGMGLILPLLPLYAQSMGAAGVWLGAIMAAHGTSSIASTPLFGWLSDRRGRKLFLCTGLLFYSLMSLGYIWAGDVLSLTLVRFLQGAASGMVIPISRAYIGDICPEGEEGKWMGYAMTAFFSGMGFGPLIGGTLTEHLGMNAAFFTMGGLNMFAFLVAVFFLPEVNPRLLKNRAPRLSFKETSQSRLVRGLFSFRMGQSIGRGAFMTFIPIYAALLGLGPAAVGVLLAINMLLGSILGIGGGRIADRFNRRALVVLGNLLFVLSIGLVPLSGNLWHLIVLAIVQGCGHALSIPAASALIVGEGRKFGMGSAMAMLTMGMNIGMAIGPVASGGIVDFAGINSAFYFGGAVGLIGTGLFIWFTSWWYRQP